MVYFSGFYGGDLHQGFIPTNVCRRQVSCFTLASSMRSFHQVGGDPGAIPATHHFVFQVFQGENRFNKLVEGKECR